MESKGVIGATATLALLGCGASGPVATARNIRTYAVPVASAPPSGMVRIVPQPAIITQTRARYEWQVVCDRSFSHVTGTGTTTTLSSGSPVNRLAGELPTVTTFYIEIDTTPHGDGSMGLNVTQGQTDAPSRPLLEPAAAAAGGTTGGMGIGGDGQREVPAAALVHPLVVSPILRSIPAAVDFATIDVPAPRFGTVEAVRYGKGAPTVGYRKRVPLDSKGDLPHVWDAPIRRLQSQGYQVQGSVDGPARHDTFRLVVKP